MNDFDKELESIEVAIQEDHELHALRKRFEESEEWVRHKQWHEEHGGSPNLRVWDEPIPVQPISSVDEDIQEIPHRRAIRVGGCDCQPRSAFMEMNDRGDVVTAGIPAPESSTKGYSAQGSSGTVYGAAPAPSENIYQAGSGQQKDLYR